MQELTCPACGAVNSLEAFLMTDDQSRALMAALAMPRSVRTALVSYLRLHNPPGRKATASKSARLLEELAALIGENRVKRAGTEYVTTPELWLAALEEVAERARMPGSALRLPLKGHGYLFEVVAGKCERRESAAERKAESQRALGGDIFGNVMRPDEMPPEPPPSKACDSPEAPEKKPIPANVKAALNNVFKRIPQ